MVQGRTRGHSMNSPEEHSAYPDNEHSSAEAPSKRQKRGKYSRACGECSRRKIKCDGAIPCGPCQFHGRSCVMSTNDVRRRRTAVSLETPQPADEARNHHEDDQQPAIKELATRMSRIERQLDLVLSSMVSNDIATGRDSEPTGGNHATSSMQALKAQLPTFAGETSISHTLTQIEGYLGHRGYSSLRRDSTPSLASLPMSATEHARHPRGMNDIRNVLTRNGIKPDRTQWNAFMKTFCDEVHILYPFLHSTSLWNNYNNMWQSDFSMEDHSAGQSDHRIAMAQIWICVALGKCTESPRVQSEEGKHSAGWSLFGAAVDLIGDLLACFRNCSDPTLVLQTFSLMVVYLFRLDANERAEKFLALTISHAHHLGFHRSKVVLQKSAFNDEMIRRLWWCLYAMDRRLSIETGHPFIIQDVNIDTPLPRDLSADWLTRYKKDPRTSAELEIEVQLELHKELITPIPYLSATIRYSRVLGKIWETIYGANVTDMFPSLALLQYLEQLSQGAQKEISSEFSAVPQSKSAGTHPEYRPWWRKKQQMLMRLRWLSLRILIRKSILHQSRRPSETKLDVLENEITCIQTACQIIREFKQVADENTISAYPFLHPLVGATVVSLGLIVKEPSFRDDYGDITLHTAKSLERYCHRTWVSGRMFRTICRLNQIASRVLCGNDSPAATRMIPGLVPEIASPTPYTSRPNSDKAPSSGVTAVGSHAAALSPAVGSVAATNFTTTTRMNEAPSSFPAPNHLVMADFDFEQSFINDIVPLGPTYEYPDAFPEMQPGAPTSTEMDWLESLLGADRNDSIEQIAEYHE